MRNFINFVMNKKKTIAALLVAGTLPLGAETCSQLTPAQTAALFCIVSSTGTVVYQGFATSSSAATKANAIGGAQIALCNSAGQIATVLGTPAAVQVSTAGVTPVATAAK